MTRSSFVGGTMMSFAAAVAVAGRAEGAGVDVAYAGSLVTAFERAIGPAFAKTGYTFHGEAKGSVALAKLIQGGLRRPDVFVSADLAVLDDLLRAQHGEFVRWYVPFAESRLVVGYAPSSAFAPAFVDVARGRRDLADVLAEPGLRLGRTDPALDPKGYRTIVALKLLERVAKRPGLEARVLGEARNPAQIFPEETLEARLESGDLDAAFLYATESAARRLPAVELPAQANLGDPKRAAEYGEKSVEIEGVVRKGTPIVYGVTVPNVARNPDGGAAFVDFLFSASGVTLLERSGLRVDLGAVVGDAASLPEHLRRRFARA
jgi:molybdate/tungstate transport system substrate-binding protein